LAEVGVSKRRSSDWQAEAIGALRAENAALVARTETRTVEPTMDTFVSMWRRWRAHLPWLIAAAVLTVMVLLFLWAPGVR
jgi:hypothetical protein